MELTSTAFEHEGNIPKEYTCDGEGICPPLVISHTPKEARSLVLICDDPDAPTGTFLHWTIWNIPPDTLTIDTTTSQEGTEGETSFGTTGYGGPCPPDGVHRYYFRVYALDITLDELPAGASREELEVAMGGHVIATAELMGRYERPPS